MRIGNKSFGGALTKPALRVLSTRNVCLRQKYTPSPRPLGALLVRLAKPMVCVTACSLVTLFVPFRYVELVETSLSFHLFLEKKKSPIGAFSVIPNSSLLIPNFPRGVYADGVPRYERSKYWGKQFLIPNSKKGAFCVKFCRK